MLEALRSGTLSLGPFLARFEAEFARRLGVPVAAAVSSGTAGLHLALLAAGAGPGDEVVTSPLSFVASANAIVYTGATPLFVDIDPRTLNLDPHRVAAAVGERTRGLLPVHIFGYPADLPAFERIAAEHDLWIVEDACEALGAVHADGVAVGARGHAAVFGFYPNKQLATGEGGMVTCASHETGDLIASLRNQGRAPDMGWLDHERLGYNYRLSELACALGVAQLERLDSMLARRAKVAGWYDAALAGFDTVTTPCPDAGDRRGWFVYVVQLAPGVDRDATIGALARVGIASKPYLPTIHLQPYYRDRFGYAEGDFPIAEDVAARSVALPFYPALTRSDVDRVASALADAVGRSA